MIRIAAMMIAGTAKLASSLVAAGGYPKPSISRRRSRSGRSSIMEYLLGSTFVAQERRNGPEGPDGTPGRREGGESARSAAAAMGKGAKPGGDGVKIARYIAPSLGV